jgi:hypothetical protein
MCPVCGYDGLRKPPADYAICPCCGTEFGYSDAGPEPQSHIHASLRKNWINHGATWHSQYTVSPGFWNPWLQLAEAKLAYEIPWLEGVTISMPTTFTRVDPIDPRPLEWKWAAA